jgi:hypothetical protein
VDLTAKGLFSIIPMPKGHVDVERVSLYNVARKKMKKCTMRTLEIKSN